MTTCVFCVDAGVRPVAAMAAAAVRLVASTAGECEFGGAVDSDGAVAGASAPVVSRTQAAGADATPDQIRRYIVQLAAQHRRSAPQDPARAQVIFGIDAGDNLETCTWEMGMRSAHPQRFVTTTRLDELTVFQWIYGMRCLDEALATMEEGLSMSALTWLGRAVAAFDILARTGARESCARFVATGPPMFKGYICKAWAMVATMYSHAALANAALTAHDEEAMSRLSVGGTAQSLAAGRMASRAVAMFRNGIGFDGVPRTVLVDIGRVCQVVEAWSNFHWAMHYYYDRDYRDVALDNVDCCITRAAPSLGTAALMREVRSKLTYDTAGTLSGLYHSLRGAARVVDYKDLPPIQTPLAVPCQAPSPSEFLFPSGG